MDHQSQSPTPQKEQTPWELAQATTEQSAPPIPPRKWTLSQRLLAGIFVVGLLWGGYFISPLSKPASIQVVGTDQVSAEAVLQYSGIAPQQSIWSILAEHDLVKTHLQQYSKKIKTASVTLTQWNQITITVQENPAVGYFNQEGQYQELLADGQLLSIENLPSNPTIPLLQNFTEESLSQLATQFDKVNPTVLALINTVTYEQDAVNAQKITLRMKDGMRVIGSLKDIGDKLNYYPGIVSQLRQKIGTIDMEVGIFYTPDVNAQ